MNKYLLLACALCAVSSFSNLQAKSKKEEPGFEDRQFKKKQLQAAENIDKWITAALAASAGSQYTKDWKLNILTRNINPFGVKLKDHNGKFTSALLVAKLGMTLRRMQLHNRYVGFNPFYLLPSMVYFMVVDMASWAWR